MLVLSRNGGKESGNERRRKEFGKKEGGQQRYRFVCARVEKHLSLKDWTQAWNVPPIIFPVALIRCSFCLLSYFLCLSVAALHQFYDPLCNNTIIALAECLEGKPE